VGIVVASSERKSTIGTGGGRDPHSHGHSPAEELKKYLGIWGDRIKSGPPQLLETVSLGKRTQERIRGQKLGGCEVHLEVLGC